MPAGRTRDQPRTVPARAEADGEVDVLVVTVEACIEHGAVDRYAFESIATVDRGGRRDSERFTLCARRLLARSTMTRLHRFPAAVPLDAAAVEPRRIAAVDVHCLRRGCVRRELER